MEDLIMWGHLVSTVVLYHGGEPLLNPRLGQMISAVKKTAVGKVKIVTDGKRLDKACSEMLLESGLDDLEVSLDSIGPTESDMVRVKSYANQIISNVRYLTILRDQTNSNLTVKISSTQFVDDYGISSFEQIVEPPIPDWLLPSDSAQEVKTTWAIQWPSGLPGEESVVFRERLTDIPNECSFIDESITVRADGTVVVCCYDLTGESNMGNVSDASLSAI